MTTTTLTEPPAMYAVMLQRDSLQKLIDIPESSRNLVRIIEICTHRLSREVYDSCIRQPSPAPEDSEEDDDMFHSLSCVIHEDDIGYIESMREADDIQRMYEGRYLRQLEQQEVFMKSGLAIAYLARAMTRFPNCHKTRLSDAHHPLGADQLANDVGYDLWKGFDASSRESQDYVKYVLRTTLAAISASGIKVAHFEICLAPVDGLRGTSSITNHVLELTADYQRLFYQSFENITTLRLVLNPGTHRYWDDNVSSFLCVFPKLLHFRLQLADNSNIPFTRIAEITRLKQLQIFELAHASTTEAYLVELLHSFGPKLEKIILCNVNIETNGGWPSLVGKFGAKPPANSLVLQDCRYLDCPLAASTNETPQTLEIVTEREAKRVVA